MPPPCNKWHCALATIHDDALSSSVCTACMASQPHHYVAIAYSSFDGAPFCVSCSDSLADNRLANLADRKRLLVLQWSEQELIYSA